MQEQEHSHVQNMHDDNMDASAEGAHVIQPEARVYLPPGAKHDTERT